ncbi:MAG: flagellar basal body rod protein FlgC [Lachnospiraceae bacterium]|nr:flagellar basal body rod protein FlgC [Lachnospiraceae bacterium]
MAMFSAFNVSTSGMTAQRLRMDILSENVANAQTTRTADGTPYRRQNVVFEEKSQSPFNAVFRNTFGDTNFVGNGVKVTQIIEDYETEMPKVYDPAHPDADEDGYVTYPNVNIITEMTDLIDATRAYEANITAFNASKTMALKGLELGK